MKLEEIVLEISHLKNELQYHLDSLVEISKRIDEINDRLDKEEIC
jgi:uncharacterized coiled-coil DUF342 family protein